MKIILYVILLVLTVSALSACVSSAVYTSNIEAKHPPIGQKVPVNGNDVHVIEQGDASGPVVLMVHGASANAREFTWTLAPRLEDNHRILIADRPGHGYSERPQNANELGVQAAQMAGVLDGLAPGKRAVLVGHSFGGAVALRTALDYPEKVGGLVLLAPVTHDWGGGGQAWYNNFAAPPVIGPIFSQLVPIVGPGQVESGVLNVFDPAPAPEGYYEKSGIGLLLRPPNFRANARDVKALEGELAAQKVRYPELEVPVIVFSGSQDTVIKPSIHVGQLKKQIEVDLRILPDEGHMPHHAHGADVADAIRSLATTPVSG